MDHRGERNGGAKLKVAEVVEIIRRAALGEGHGAIAKDFGVRRQAVSLIGAKRRWAHIQGERA